MLGIRIWDNGKMIYPKKFSVIIDYVRNVSSIKIQDKENFGLITEKPMYLTPGFAINGEIYELDIIADNTGDYGVVKFSESIGCYFANINGQDIPIKKDMYDYEIVGNVYEDIDYINNFKQKSVQISNESNKEKSDNSKNIVLDKKQEKVQTKPAKKEYPKVSIYTYVSAKNTAAYIMKSGDIERTITKQFGKERLFSEIECLLSALKDLKSKCDINVYTTSKLLIAPFEREWIGVWASNEWKKSNGEEVKNKDYWKRLYDEISKHEYKISYIEPGASIVELLRCQDMCKEKEGSNA